MGAMLEAVSIEEWQVVVRSALEAAKSGDASARGWLAQYLIGRPSTTAPAPLTVVVQQLSGQDPVVEKLAAPLIHRLENPAFHCRDDLKDVLKARVAAELSQIAEQALREGNSIDSSAMSPDPEPQ